MTHLQPVSTYGGINTFKQRLLAAINKKDGEETKPLYIATPLEPLPVGGEFESKDINEKNQITGWCYNAKGHLRAVVWEEGHVKNLRLPKNELSWGTTGNAINDHGNVAGQSQKQTEQTLDAMIYINGNMRAIQPFEEEGHSVANGINENNEVVGWGAYQLVEGEEGSDEKKLIHHAFLWKAGKITDLEANDEMASSYANDLNNDGQIVGHSEVKIEETYSQRAVLWNKNTQEMIVLDQRERAIEESDAYAINASDPPQIVGKMLVYQNGPYVSHGFFWEGEQMVDLGTYGNCLFSVANDINNKEIIAGSSYGYPCSDDPQEYKAILWMFNQKELVNVDLNQLITDDHCHLSTLVAINDAYFIAGNGFYRDKPRAFLLTPTQ